MYGMGMPVLRPLVVSDNLHLLWLLIILNLHDCIACCGRRQALLRSSRLSWRASRISLGHERSLCFVHLHLKSSPDVTPVPKCSDMRLTGLLLMEKLTVMPKTIVKPIFRVIAALMSI